MDRYQRQVVRRGKKCEKVSTSDCGAEGECEVLTGRWGEWKGVRLKG